MQNLTSCPACRRDVSRQASQCPHCGHPMAGKKTEQTTGFDALIVMGAIVLTCIIMLPLTDATGSRLIGFLIAIIPTVLAFAFASRKKD
jgi:uncharacterized paraquat-inducible protein A